MRVVALLAVRNEARYLARCLEHLLAQGVETCLIDNDSDDATPEIARAFVGRGVFRVERLPFTGRFELEAQLRLKERLAAEIDADWFVHHDADEVREAPAPHATLRGALEAVDRGGFNAVDFDEFVFLPARGEDFEGRDYVAGMRHYYYYEPEAPDRFRVTAWKKQPRVDLVSSAGHHVDFPGLRVAPERFVMRHYLVLSAAHAAEKYGRRRFSEAELARSWHGDRAGFRADDFALPPAGELEVYDAARGLDRSRPRSAHPLFASPAGGPAAGETLERLREFRRASGGAVPEIPPVPAGAPRPFWSVMLPVYEPDERHLALALEGVLDQDPGPAQMQVAVLDDASARVDVAAIVERVGRGRIELLRNARNLGLVGNWNACVAAARGAWVHVLHQDDRVLPGFYARLRGPCGEVPGLAAAFTRCAGVDAEGRVRWEQAPERAAPGVLADALAREAGSLCMLAPAVVIRRAVYEAVGGYHEGLAYCADWDMYRRAAAAGPVWYEPQCLAWYRRHAGSETSRLAASGATLADHRRAAALAREYLPPDVTWRTEAAAMKAGMVWAADLLRERLERDDLGGALAQARELVATLEALADGGAPAAAAPEVELLRERVGRLEAQVRAWARAAELVAGRPAPARGPGDGS